MALTKAQNIEDILINKIYLGSELYFETEDLNKVGEDLIELYESRFNDKQTGALYNRELFNKKSDFEWLYEQGENDLNTAIDKIISLTKQDTSNINRIAYIDYVRSIHLKFESEVENLISEKFKEFSNDHYQIPLNYNDIRKESTYTALGKLFDTNSFLLKNGAKEFLDYVKENFEECDLKFLIEDNVLMEIKYKDNTILDFRKLNFLRNPIVAYRIKIGDPIKDLAKYYSF